jgi:hypothetical protein
VHGCGGGDAPHRCTMMDLAHHGKLLDSSTVLREGEETGGRQGAHHGIFQSSTGSRQSALELLAPSYLPTQQCNDFFC